MECEVSICIPTYNQTKFLSKTLESIAYQTYSNYEIIVTDDSTNDSVINLLKEFNFGDKLRYYKNPIRLGSPENWNEAIRKANGKYIKLLHHDDFLLSTDSLGFFVEKLDNNHNSDIVFCNTLISDSNYNIKNYFEISNKQIKRISKTPLFLLKGYSFGSPSACLFRNFKNYFFDKNLIWLVDIYFYIKVLQNNIKFEVIQDTLISTINHENQISRVCENNFNLEFYEYLYIIDNLNLYDNFKILKYILFLLLNKYKFIDIKDMFNKYDGHISSKITNSKKLLKNIDNYRKFRQTINYLWNN